MASLTQKLTSGKVLGSRNISKTLGTTLGVWQTTNMTVMAIEARVILASRFRTTLTPPWLLSPSLFEEEVWWTPESPFPTIPSLNLKGNPFYSSTSAL